MYPHPASATRTSSVEVVKIRMLITHFLVDHQIKANTRIVIPANTASAVVT